MKLLVFRILVLALLILCIVLSPIAAHVAALILLGVGLCVGIVSFFKTGMGRMSGGELILAIIVGFALIIQAGDFMEALQKPETARFWSMLVLCGGLIYVSHSIFRRFVWHEADYCYMDEKVHKLTKFYPTLVTASAIIRIVVELAPVFLGDIIADFQFVFDIGEGVGIILFVISMAQYVVRMIHIYQNNR